MSNQPKPQIPTNLLLETKRCILRYPSRDDAPAMLSAFTSPTFPKDLPLGLLSSLGEVHGWIDHCQAGWTDGHIYSWVVEHKHNANLVGQTTLAYVPASDSWSLAYWIRPNYWGRGYATEAARKVLQFGSETLKVTRFWAGSALWNAASERVLQKLGMEYVATNPAGYTIQGKPVPTKDFELSMPAI